MLNLIEQLLWKMRYDVSPDDVNLIYDHSEQQTIEGMFVEYVLPHVAHQPRVLNVGFGFRIEEIIALEALNPRSITGVDCGTRNMEIAFPKWELYQRSRAKSDRSNPRPHISLHERDVRSLPDKPYDLVCAMRIHPLLQNEADLKRLIGLSSGLVFVSCWRNSGIKYGVGEEGYDYPSHYRTEAEHIDHLFEPYAEHLIHAMQPVDAEESHIWVLDASRI